jgi:hypothetical protein
MDREGYESDKSVIKIFDVIMDTILTSHLDISFDSLEWGYKTEREILNFPHLYRFSFSPLTYILSLFPLGTSRIFRLTLDFSSTGSIVGLRNIEVMVGDENRSFLSLLLAPAIATQVTNGLKSNSSQEKNQDRVFLYYLESTLTSPNELKMAIMTDNDLSLFVPFEDFVMEIGLCIYFFIRIIIIIIIIADFNIALILIINSITLILSTGLVPQVHNRSHNIRSIFCVCPEYTNGDFTIADVTNHYFKGANGEYSKGLENCLQCHVGPTSTYYVC